MADKPNIRLFQFSLEQIAHETGYSIAYLRSVRQGHQPVTPPMRTRIPLIYRRSDLFDEVGEEMLQRRDIQPTIKTRRLRRR
jgi:hypothetical protein